MQNKRKLQVVSAVIGGKNYKLAYDFNKICDVERESGGNLLHGLMNLGNMGALQLSGLLCAAMRAADPKSKITVPQVSELLKFETILPFSDALAQSILLSLPEKPKAAPAADEPPVEETPADEPTVEDEPAVVL